jgi:uncharacterized protein YecT (DUF1311 family)
MVRRAILGFLAIGGAFIASAAPAAQRAHEAWESPAYGACMDKSQGVTVDMHDCAATEFTRRDGELNIAYQALMKVLDRPEEKGAWRKAQRAWVAFRDAQCEADASPDAGGSIEPLIIDSCATRMTYKRTQELREALKAAKELQS